ncbi:MAG: hypothetical protein A2845_00095 [Candidatus Lloydbacteria bacterium RIFCSPHIGHO2_01_FULL_49_22]|uniref:Uncharacterized protein n=1 Tax=Candidatus Lloydbacteria bacterium RIFCSPHIGHO2_01_FULL_49_22 TaxID=1798658 RepID=A0A1G2CXY2_9BACT|nr:MAG: hypothetical protein A2845_00095 [Candidatus Lloydbacteria bacterium RIFCSPHIGHO2_01_FULL_49_22]
MFVQKHPARRVFCFSKDEEGGADTFFHGQKKRVKKCFRSIGTLTIDGGSGFSGRIVLRKLRGSNHGSKNVGKKTMHGKSCIANLFLAPHGARE